MLWFSLFSSIDDTMEFATIIFTSTRDRIFAELKSVISTLPSLFTAAKKIALRCVRQLAYLLREIIEQTIRSAHKAGMRASNEVESGISKEKIAAYVKVFMQYIGTTVTTALGMIMDRFSDAELDGKEREEIRSRVKEHFKGKPKDVDFHGD